MSPWTERLIEAGAQLGLVVSPGAAERAERFRVLLEKWSARIDLTTIREPDEVLEKHFLDSWAAAPRIPAGATLLDAGSGAGFPGLALLLLRPDLRVTSVESKTKKAVFQREVCRALDLDAEVLDRRVEEVVGTRTFEVVAARALAPLPELLALLGPGVRESDGILLAYKGPGVIAELEAVGESTWHLDTQEIVLPLSGGKRTLVWARPIPTAR